MDFNVLINSPDREWTYPINSEASITVKGFLGNTIVRIHNNEAWVESSPCLNQVCIAAGRINRHGSWIACLPNRVFLLIEGNNKGEQVDAIAW